MLGCMEHVQIALNRLAMAIASFGMRFPPHIVVKPLTVSHSTLGALWER